jgi:hypothetical protein
MNSGDQGTQKRKPKVFTPVTMRMIKDAPTRPDDVLEMDGEAIDDVSLNLESTCRLLWLED